MATRCNIILPGAIIYRHWDGYPTSILPDIADWMTGAAAIGDGSGDYEPTDNIHGDIDYLYTVNILRRRVTVWKRDWKRGFMRCNALVEARETVEHLRAKALEGAHYATAEAIAEAERTAERIAGFQATTGYALTSPAPRLRVTKPKPAPVAAPSRWEGARYRETAGLRVVQVAKLVRKDIRAAQRAGDLPAGKLSIRSDYNSIRVELTPNNPAAIIGDEWVRDRARLIADGIEHLSPSSELRPGRAEAAKIEAILAAYNYDASDIQSDYFDSRFYGNVDVTGWEDIAETQARALAETWRAAR